MLFIQLLPQYSCFLLVFFCRLPRFFTVESDSKSECRNYLMSRPNSRTSAAHTFLAGGILGNMSYLVIYELSWLPCVCYPAVMKPREQTAGFQRHHVWRDTESKWISSGCISGFYLERKKTGNQIRPLQATVKNTQSIILYVVCCIAVFCFVLFFLQKLTHFQVSNKLNSTVWSNINASEAAQPTLYHVFD